MIHWRGQGLPILLLGVTSLALLPGRAETFRPRMVLGGEYWWMAPDEAYLEYLAAVRPDLIHGGVIGPELASGVQGRGTLKAITPLHPAEAGTIRAYLAWWQAYLKDIRALDIKVQATFSLVNAWGDHETQSGWFQYFNALWETDLLGPRPAERAEDLMERNGEGELERNEGTQGWYRYRGCVNHPGWRETLKRFVRTGIDAGFDGMMIQYSHARGNCLCEHCQDAFRSFLDARHQSSTLEERFGITNLATHRFSFTAPRQGMPTPMDREARAFSEDSVRACFETVFVQYGRSLKHDLILSKWYHFRRFLASDVKNTVFEHIIDERMMRDAQDWCTGEDYVWHSSPMYGSDLKQGVAGDAALDGRYLRAMSGSTPFLVLKYDYFRWRVTAAEALAQGGIVFGCWKGGWSGGSDRDDPHFNRYFEFIRENNTYWQQRTCHADVGLLFPRSALQNGEAGFLDRFRQVGRSLVSEHVLFDMIIDQSMTKAALEQRRMLLVPAPMYLSAAQRSLLDEYRSGGGTVVAWGEPDRSYPVDWQVYTGTNVQSLIATMAVAAGDFSTFVAPWTVQVYADWQKAQDRFLLHLVNFDRDESQSGKELPLAAASLPVSFRLPSAYKVQRVLFLTPEVDRIEVLPFEQVGERLLFKAPEWLVYGLCVIEGSVF